MPDILETVRSEDFVEYFLYVVDNATTDPERLQELRKSIFSSYSSAIENYIWHRDEFNLSKIIESTDNTPSHLHGIVHYGENIEDEWFVVYLLIKISSQFHDVFVRVTDPDGEFLLIEAADHLPKWISAENSSNQVFIHKGDIRLSQGLLNNSKQSSSITDIIGELPKSSVSTTEKSITRCINERVQKYDDGLDELMHHARAYLPAKIAALLDAKPGLIASAVTAFCQRDPIDMKICKKMETFPPHDMILRRVKFTKFLYAMISGHKTYPEKKSPWKLPPSSSPQFKDHHLGYKISYGFEILASKCSEKSKHDLKLSKKWHQYLKVLERKDYFKGLLQGSKEYVELEKKARIYFLENVGVEEAESDEIMNYLQTIDYDVNLMKEEESKLPPSDDEKWMEINGEELNKLLEKKFGFKTVNASDSPDVLSNTINKFLNSASGIDGVEFENDRNLNAMDIDETNQNASVDFNADDFISSLDKMLRIVDAEKNEDGDSDMSDFDDSDDYESEADAEITSYMNLMDKELQAASLSDRSGVKSKESTDDIVNAYLAQNGSSGPAGNLLHSLGLELDLNTNDRHAKKKKINR